MLIITIVREAVEEMRCFLRDKEVNSQIYSKLCSRGDMLFSWGQSLDSSLQSFHWQFNYSFLSVGSFWSKLRAFECYLDLSMVLWPCYSITRTWWRKMANVIRLNVWNINSNKRMCVLILILMYAVFMCLVYFDQDYWFVSLWSTTGDPLFKILYHLDLQI